MATRELLVIILNHTNEELNIEPQSPSLDHGHWIDTPDSRPPQMILAGESGMLRCKSSHIGGGIEGSITYRVVGFDANNKVTFLWNVPYVGPNKFDCSCAIDAFTVKVLGGRGNQAVVVFVFERALRTDPRLDDGVFAAIS
ncbi:hypothetical protein FOQG_16504 [Fusarium oxysporum f. sp. raphani 54005]|uniref:Uncharacterized protein n=1 Tax=Fusarium oxysporum f. sp. raphani 54005 TaxID=1089458 RepID=X0BIZ9_FUSOX|nr:hypothetical protein FOQG_16504 [Fusarium oxysporum f. sp. raphani 54005]KAH7202755.1 hypothetical protein BKA60DRAFT_581013 [Fusarium oxysporum]